MFAATSFGWQGPSWKNSTHSSLQRSVHNGETRPSDRRLLHFAFGRQSASFAPRVQGALPADRSCDGRTITDAFGSGTSKRRARCADRDRKTAILDSKELPLWSERVLAAFPHDHPLATREAVCRTDVRGQTVLFSHYDPGKERRPSDFKV